MLSISSVPNVEGYGKDKKMTSLSIGIKYFGKGPEQITLHFDEKVMPLQEIYDNGIFHDTLDFLEKCRTPVPELQKYYWVTEW